MNLQPFMVSKGIFYALTLLFLIGCAGTETQLPPTRVPLAPSPVISTPTTTPVGLNDGGLLERPTITAVPINNSQEPIPPTPQGFGVRPQLAQQYWVPDSGPETSTEERPPPFDVPLSLHPDDHYWFIRPIPSGFRNYDLEWYPYGNDVLNPNLGPYRIHHGLDFPNETGTPILAAGRGTVIYTGALPSPRNGVNYYGNTVIIQHDWQWQEQDVYTLYAHTLELFVNEGDVVEQGQLIAGVGSSGEVSGPHLHFEVRIGDNNYGSTRNPALWLAPFEGYGTLAGRLVDSKGRFIPGAEVEVIPLQRQTAVRQQLTYQSPAVRPDEIWRENFVVGDLPAGDYRLHVTINDITYERTITLLPGQTNFVVISTLFEFIPTPTPEPTLTPTPTSMVDPTIDTTPEPTPTP